LLDICGKRSDHNSTFQQLFDLSKEEPKIEEPSMMDLLSVRQMGTIRVHPSFNPAAKLLSIRSIWTTVGQALCPVGFITFNPVRINEPVKSPPSYVYQFHLSASLHYIIATQLPDTQYRLQNRRSLKPTQVGWNDEGEAGLTWERTGRLKQTLSDRRSRTGKSRCMLSLTVCAVTYAREVGGGHRKRDQHGRQQTLIRTVKIQPGRRVHNEGRL